MLALRFRASFGATLRVAPLGGRSATRLSVDTLGRREMAFAIEYLQFYPTKGVACDASQYQFRFSVLHCSWPVNGQGNLLSLLQIRKKSFRKFQSLNG